MDFNQRDYYFQMQQLQQMRQMPYPFMYPYPDLYMSEMETDRDLQYLQQMYPADAKRMQKKVEEACDKLEYEGSMMYDEYPDRVSMLLICDRIANEMAKEDAERQAKEQADRIGDLRPENRPGADMNTQPGMQNEMGQEQEMNAMQMRRPGPGMPPPPPPMDRGRRNLLEVLLFNEMHKRRCKRRQCRRFW